MNTSNIQPVFNLYSTLEYKDRTKFRNKNYLSMLLSFFAEMFEIEGLNEVQSDFLMTELFLKGTCLIEKTPEGKYIFCSGYYYGVPEADELYPDTYQCVKPNYQFDGKLSEHDNVTVCYLNHFLAPVTEFQWFADMLAETDTSLLNNVKFCRVAPVGVVQDDKTKSAFEKCVENMLDGELVNTVTSYIDLNGAIANLSTIDISDGKYTDKIQYLSMFHEQLLSRVCKMFGVSYNVLSKSANITTDELGNCDVFASILPMNMKECLNIGLEKIGLHAEFSKQWKWIDTIDLKAEANNASDETRAEDKPEGEAEGSDDNAEA